MMRADLLLIKIITVHKKKKDNSIYGSIYRDSSWWHMVIRFGDLLGEL